MLNKLNLTTQMKKILFPTDFSQVSQHALRFAIDFAKECNAVIDVWTVYQLVAVDAGNLPPTYLEELIREKGKVWNLKWPNL